MHIVVYGSCSAQVDSTWASGFTCTTAAGTVNAAIYSIISTAFMQTLHHSSGFPLSRAAWQRVCRLHHRATALICTQSSRQVECCVIEKTQQETAYPRCDSRPAQANLMSVQPLMRNTARTVQQKIKTIKIENCRCRSHQCSCPSHNTHPPSIVHLTMPNSE